MWMHYETTVSPEYEVQSGCAHMGIFPPYSLACICPKHVAHAIFSLFETILSTGTL